MRFRAPLSTVHAPRKQLRLEQLESREVPASVFSYTDADGDRVNLTLSAGTLSVSTINSGVGVIPSLIDLTAAVPGAKFNMSIARSPTGDGLANVGYVNAIGVDLGSVTIKGDLGRLHAGDADPKTPGLRALAVQSLGRLGSYTQGGSADRYVRVEGPLGTVTVRGDIFDAELGSDSGIGSMTIGGSVVDASIGTSGKIGVVRIGGNIERGRVASGLGLNSISVGGSVIGGLAVSTGHISSAGTIGRVFIGGNLQGGAATFSGDFSPSGCISGKRIGRVTIGGSIIAGVPESGVQEHSGAIVAFQDIGSIDVKGSLIGNPTSRVLIYARGQESPATLTDIAIRNLTVAGRVEHAWIFGGVNELGVGVNGNAQIGSVRVGGDWVASSMASGATSSDGIIGNGNDAALPGGTRSRIGGIDIRGQVIGRPYSNATFGIFAQEIGSFKLGGVSLALKKGKSNDTFALNQAIPLGSSQSDITSDRFAVHVYEV